MISLIVRTVSVDVKQHLKKKKKKTQIRTQEMCESRGGRPGLPIPNQDGLCGHKATLEEEKEDTNPRSGDVRKSRWTSWAPHSPYGLCGHKATLEEEKEDTNPRSGAV